MGNGRVGSLNCNFGLFGLISNILFKRVFRMGL